MTAPGQSPFDTSKKWPQMSGRQKVVFVCKFILFLCTFGFAFPTLLD